MPNRLMFPMHCNKCGKEPQKEDKDGWEIIKMDCVCGGRIVTDFTKPYYKD